MNSKTIYSILSQKSSKRRKIQKYVRFIELCRYQNFALDSSTYMEGHHILPKSIYPEFENLRNHEWNKVLLTQYQHLISHVKLADIFGGKQIQSLQIIIAKINNNLKLNIKIGNLNHKTLEIIKQKLILTESPIKHLKTYTNGFENIRLAEHERIPAGFYAGMKAQNGIDYYYTNTDKSIVLKFTGPHSIPNNFVKISKAVAETIQNIIILNTIEIENLIDAHDLYKKCANDDGKLSIWGAKLMRKHLPTIKCLIAAEEHISDQTVLQCAFLNMTPPKCNCCGKQVNKSDGYKWKEYCGYSCASKIRSMSLHKEIDDATGKLIFAKRK